MPVTESSEQFNEVGQASSGLNLALKQGLAEKDDAEDDKQQPQNFNPCEAFSKIKHANHCD
jgi:hypothetical protein